MRLRTFTASDMPSAMQMVREAMGENAVILSSQPVNGKSISVTAALDHDEEGETRTQTAAHAPAVENLRFELQNILRYHNLPELFVAKLMQQISDHDLSSVATVHKIGGKREPYDLYRMALEKMAGAYFTFDPLLSDARDRRMMILGPPGIGKTTTIAKLAAKLTVDKEPVIVITADNKRAGGVEQLQAFTSILGVELHAVTSRAELWKCLQPVGADTRVLIDTAGCNPYDEASLNELKSYASLEHIEPVLALPCGGDSLEALDMTEEFMALPVRRLLITRADAARRFGSVLATAAAHELALCNVSYSSNVADAIASASPALVAQMLLRYQYKTDDRMTG